LLAGGLIAEIIHISTGDPNRPTTEFGRFIPIVFAIIFYFLLTYILKQMGKIE
jgi:hypothetical protein